MNSKSLTFSTFQALISSLKDAAAELHLLSQSHAENKCLMSVTSDVSHVEMWPYIASAAALSSIQARTAVRMLTSPNAPSKNVGASVTHMPPSERPRTTPHDVDSHWVPENTSWKVCPPPQASNFTPSSKHQPRSWSKFEARMNIQSIAVLSTAQPLMSWLKDPAPRNIAL